MKKAFLLIASAALLFAGCQKEQLAQNAGNDGDQVTVTFTAGLAPEGTKAVIDNDGKAVNVNHWVLEVYDNEGLFYEVERDVTAGTLQQTYELKLFKNQAYTLLFWADTKGAYNTTDLRAISTVGSVANKDSRDAFYAKVPYTSLVSESKNVTLTRPFAQLNIITNDLAALMAKVATGAYGKYAPANLQVKATVPTTFNLMTETAGEAAEQTLTAAASYGSFSDPAELGTTLFMDYIFASTSKELKDMKFSFTSNNNEISYDFTNIPLQRNYRTNIKGQLMSNDSKWTVTIDPTWDSGETGAQDFNVFYTEVNEASEVKGAITAKTNDTSKNGQSLSVTINNEVGTGATNDDIIIPDSTPKETTPEIILDFKKLKATAQIIIRDEEHPRDATEAIAGAHEYDGEVVVIVPEGTQANQVKILTNKSTVTVRGEYGTVIASCAPQTIVVEKGTVIGTLEVMKGNVEVYGKVTNITNSTDPQEVVYVYMYDGGEWINLESQKSGTLVPLYPVASIGANEYFSLQDAVDAAPANAEIKVLGDIVGDGIKVKNDKNFTLNFGGHTYTIDGNTVGSQGTETNGMQLLKGSTLKFVNGTIVSTKAKLLIQNYANLTLEDMNLDLSGATQTAKNYVISNNCGNVQILGNTSLKSRANGGVAFDVYYWPYGGYSEGVNVVVNTTGTITGKIEIAHDNSVSDETASEKTSLKIQNGTFDAFAISAFDGANVEISGGKFSTEPKAEYIVNGFVAKKGSDDYYTLVESDSWVAYAAKTYASKDVSAKTVTIATPEQLALLKNELSRSVNYSGYTITITENLDMKAHIWEPINSFSGMVLDGTNHTISNLTINANNQYGNAFIMYSYNSTIKNITFDKASVSRKNNLGSGNVYAVVTAYAGYYANATFENVTVKNSSVTGYGKIGAIAGMAEMQGHTLTFKDCKVESTTLKGTYNVAGLIGLFQYQVSGNRNTIIIENSTSDYTFVPAELPDGQFSSRKTIDGLTGSYLVYPYGDTEYYYAESAKYYCEYNNPAYDSYMIDAVIHNEPDNIIPEK